ncbi:MAG: FAD-dependent oxidoreductase [Veillonellales bacterium]
MAETYRFDVIVIGAGPAGIACACKLAKAGKKTLVIDRAKQVGGKNLTGGRVYTYALELVEPGLHKKAALERPVVREQVMVLSDTSAMSVDYYNPELAEDIPQSYTVLRGNFDDWFAAYAEQQGAVLVDGIRVDDLVIENGQVVGIRAGDDVVYADTVVAADGVNSLVAQQAGLRNQVSSHSVGVGVKETIALPAAAIERRFNLNPGQGVARTILGGTQGIIGGGFLYTNKESVSLGVVLNPDSVAEKGLRLYDVFQEFKMHPALQALLGDGETIEYGAHLVPEAGWRGVPQRLYRPGLVVVGDAAGFVVNTGTILRGIDLAILSGIAAAQAVITAAAPEAVGPAYQKELERLNVIPTMRLYAGWPEITQNPRMASTYPTMMNAMAGQMFTVSGDVPEKINTAMLRIAKQHVGIKNLLADGWKGFRAI